MSGSGSPRSKALVEQIASVTQLVVAMVPVNLVSSVVNAQILDGVITPLILTQVLVLANRVRFSKAG
jgi:hypothetical protein